jgi:hypothetical protein
VASRSWPAKTVIIRSGRTLCWTTARTAGRILPAAHPQIEFTTTMTVPFWAMAFSTSAAVRASLIPAEVSSCRIGATIISGYMKFLPFLIQFYQEPSL